ncbi:RecQ family ATP-dependent DNA helicase [Bacillus horti]|uniref:ATP-dependent DNA helicase RecQ n=1 Tax=Caldalkalibacillus horti TaxID=77523 RepID=A0ABT9W4K1_9BACI|nr:RecQ family ATP-dependent DNA helicase [Bacillus horti]MDQ0168176.1 ATP-dependent DNA helicase RecQ [Bacillus horti]
MLRILKKEFGYSSFQPGQLEVIQSILAGKDTFLIQATGGGKSLCYQLPSLLLEGITVVISPLISLMEDQVKEARRFGRKDIIAFHSGHSVEQRKYILAHLHQYKLILISPEGLQSDYMINALQRRRVSLFVVDEAHCISQWGHDFRMEYLTLKETRDHLGRPVCLALTATATSEVKQDIIHFGGLIDPQLFEHTVDRPKIKLEVEHVDTEEEKRRQILSIVQARQDAGLIYCSTRAKTEELVEYLFLHGIEQVAYYHGGLSAEERFMIQEQYLNGELKLVCATNAFGMGVNKSNIRYVIHYHFPNHIEQYVQEMGRCSRDGKDGLSYVLVQNGDEHIPYHFIENEFLTKEQLKVFLQIQHTSEEQGSVIELEEWKELLFCSEQSISVVLHHYKNAVSLSREAQLEALDWQFEQLKRKKRNKVASMIRWLQLEASACRRKEILDYFSQSMEAPPLVCCDLCDQNRAMAQNQDKHSLQAQESAQDQNRAVDQNGSRSRYEDIDSHNNPTVQKESFQRVEQLWSEKLKRLWPIPARDGE